MYGGTCILFIYSSVDKHLDWFPFLAIMNNVDMNKSVQCIQMQKCVQVLCGYICSIL